MTETPLILPAMCPLCGVLMQRSTTEGLSVAPHYKTVHPGKIIPLVAQ